MKTTMIKRTNKMQIRGRPVVTFDIQLHQEEEDIFSEYEGIISRAVVREAAEKFSTDDGKDMMLHSPACKPGARNEKPNMRRKKSFFILQSVDSMPNI
jgi:hypothetical protein